MGRTMYEQIKNINKTLTSKKKKKRRRKMINKMQINRNSDYFNKKYYDAYIP